MRSGPLIRLQACLLYTSKIGFLTKEEGFVLYERNEKISSFPDINGYGLGKWHAFMPDDYTIFMNWACYDIKMCIRDSPS